MIYLKGLISGCSRLLYYGLCVLYSNVVLEKDGEDQLDSSCVNENVLLRVKERNIQLKQTEGKLSELVTQCVRTARQNMLLKERWREI